MIARLRVLSEHTLVGLLLAVLAVGILHTAWLQDWDQVVYDWNLRLWPQPVPEDIVIVAIDQPSLNQLGRWPWPRHTHAEMVQRLADVGSGPVALDMILSESDLIDPSSDQALAEAIERHGRVVLPVVFEKLGVDGPFTELRPNPVLDASGVHLGHVDTDLDTDGIVRRIFLKAGIDSAYWPGLALELLRLEGNGNPTELPGRRTDLAPTQLAMWDGLERDNEVWFRFAGPPGSINAVSYHEVLDNPEVAASLRDKTVLVGFTAPGIDVLPTPVSAQRNPMPGVEIHANVLATLRSGLGMQPLAFRWQALLTAAFALIPLLFYARLSPRWAPLAACLSLLPPLLASFLLLRLGDLWYPPLTALLAVIVGYVIWSWQRLQSTLRYLNRELEQLNAEPDVLPTRRMPQLSRVMVFLRHAMPAVGAAFWRGDGELEQQWGETPEHPGLTAIDDVWIWHHASGASLMGLPEPSHIRLVGIRWQDGEVPSRAEQYLLDKIVKPYLRGARTRPRTPVERLQLRIQQVQTATERLRAMRSFINGSLAQMADGVLVSDALGQTLLANPMAALYLLGDSEADLSGEPLSELLARLEFTGRQTWQQSLPQVLVDRELVQLPARSRTGHDLLVHMTPLADDLNRWSGLIINFADISELRASERRRAEMMNFLSHDLRSPLASVMALTQLAEYKPEELSSGRITEQIAQRTHAILGLVDDFLQLARAESSDEVALADLDLVPVAEEALQQVQPLVESKGSSLNQDIRCQDAWISGNSGLLRRMLVNLLTNAIKYSPEGATITLSLAVDGDDVACEVRDTGYGISAENLPLLFDRFRRIQRKEHKAEKGTGLGLAFVKTVIDRHHGNIEVESELNRGTLFRMRFPARTFEMANEATA